jgi:hypothetical protein
MRVAALSVAGALAVLAALPTIAQGEKQNLSLALDTAGKCHMRFAGKDVVVTGIGSLAGLGLDPKRDVHLVADISIPYRCVGGVIYVLQANGFRDVGFNAAPPH